MTSLGAFFFVIIYFGCAVGIAIFVLRMLWRFVRAHERLASALDVIARKMRDEAKP